MTPAIRVKTRYGCGRTTENSVMISSWTHAVFEWLNARQLWHNTTQSKITHRDSSDAPSVKGPKGPWDSSVVRLAVKALALAAEPAILYSCSHR
jgi:hypothetical protein